MDANSWHDPIWMRYASKNATPDVPAQVTVVGSRDGEG